MGWRPGGEVGIRRLVVKRGVREGKGEGEGVSGWLGGENKNKNK